MTLFQDIQLCDSAVYAMKSRRNGRGFLPADSLVKATGELADLRARMELLLAAHPELENMYAEHKKLLNDCYKHQSIEKETLTVLQQKCSGLAREIVALERSVDLGGTDLG